MLHRRVGLLAGIGVLAASVAACPPHVVHAQRVAASGVRAPRAVVGAMASGRVAPPGIVHQDDAPRRASLGRIVAQVAGGFAGAALLGMASWALLDDPEGPDRRVKGDAGYTPDANTAYAIGSFVGGTVGAYLIGRGDGSRGSIAATAAGVAVATVPLAFGRHEPYLPLLGLVIGAPIQGIGGTLGYQLTRRGPAGRTR